MFATAAAKVITLRVAPTLDIVALTLALGELMAACEDIAADRRHPARGFALGIHGDAYRALERIAAGHNEREVRNELYPVEQQVGWALRACPSLAA